MRVRSLKGGDQVIWLGLLLFVVLWTAIFFLLRRVYEGDKFDTSANWAAISHEPQFLRLHVTGTSEYRERVLRETQAKFPTHRVELAPEGEVWAGCSASLSNENAAWIFGCSTSAKTDSTDANEGDKLD